MEKVVLWILTLLSAVSITFFSSQPSAASAATSRGVTEIILEIVTDYSTALPETQSSMLESFNGIVRSLAHFVSFLILGFFLFALLKQYPLRHYFIIAIGICMLYAVFDECLQGLLASGRAMEFVDLLKDWSGSLAGISISALVFRILKARFSTKKM